MGEVYLMEDSRINRQVAIKVIRSEVGTNPDNDVTKDAGRLFQREARAIAKLDHPHILPLYDFGEENLNATTLTYMVMPFCPEDSLGYWLSQRRGSRSLSPQDVVYFVDQAADALQYAHDHQTLHLDVKPSNFLIRSNPRDPERPYLLLADFGIARLSAATSNSSLTVRGTPTFMAPEQWSSSPVTATDQYALAVMTYDLLVGRPPFTGSLEQLMYQHFQAQPQAPSALNPRLSGAIDAVLLRALAKQPQDRFPSVAAFADALKQAVNELVIDSDEQTAPALIPNHQAKVTPPPPPRIEPLSPTVPVRPSSEYVPTVLAIPNQGLPPLNRETKLSRSQLSSTKTILRVGLVVLIIASVVGLFLVTRPNQGSGTKINTITTANANITATANAFATARIASFNAASTAQALTVTANTITPNIIQNLYNQTTAQTPKLDDPLRDNSKGYGWNEVNDSSGGTCAFTGRTYHIIQINTNFVQICNAATTNFSDFTFQVQMKIIKGESGGIIFRSDTSASNFYLFSVDQSGSYQLILYSNGNTPQPLTTNTSTVINQGLNQINLIAVTAKGNTIGLFVNNQLIDNVNDSAYGNGLIGLGAIPSSSPVEVVYSNAKVWT
jgi:serine/threonine protein kinase